MGLTRKCQTVDDEATLNLTVSRREARPPTHLARFVAEVIMPLDVRRLSVREGTRGGEPFAPEIVLGVRFYGYATGVGSTRRIEKATYASLPLRVLAGDLHPDHDTIAHFRKTFLPERTDLLVQVVFVAHAAGVLTGGTLSLDGTTIHADASTRHAGRSKRLLVLEQQLLTGMCPQHSCRFLTSSGGGGPPRKVAVWNLGRNLYDINLRHVIRP